MKIIDSMKGTIAECKEEVKRTISDSRGGEQMPQSEFESEIDKSEYEKNRLTKDTIKRKIADVESINITVEPLKIYTVLDHLIDISHSDIDSAGNSYCRSYARAISPNMSNSWRCCAATIQTMRSSNTTRLSLKR